MDCVFCKIVASAIPSKKLYEDELVIAIQDVRPQAPTHALVLPRAHIVSLYELEDEALAGRLLSVAARIARDAGLRAGFRVIANSGAHGGQEVMHLHLHVFGGRPLGRMLQPAPKD